MKTTTRSTAVHPQLPVPLRQPRQLSISFETPAIRGLGTEHRAAVLQALAALLLEAATAHLPEDDDVEP